MLPGAVALAAPVQGGFAFTGNLHFHGAVAVFFLQAMADQCVWRVGLEVFLVQQAVDLLGGHFQAQAVGFTLYHLAEFDLHATRQADAIFLLEQVGDTAFARLAVDADYRFVAAADVGRVDRQVWHLPQFAFLLLGEALRMASWCEPENAVWTRSPTYGWRGCTGSWLHSSTTLRTPSMSEKSSNGSMPWV